MAGEQRSLISRAMTLVVVAVCFSVVRTSTILLVPFPSYSHVNPLVTMAEMLTEKGHTVHMLLPSLYGHMANLKSTTRVKVIEYQVKAWEWNAAMHAGKIDAAMDYFDYVTQTTQLADIKAKYNGYYLLCKELLSSKILDRQLRRGMTFDLGIVDSHPLTRCHYALMYKYGIPYVSYSQIYDPWLSWSPAMPSYVPIFLTELTDEMSFWQRVVNVWTVLYWYLGNNLPADDQQFVAEYVPDKSPISARDLAIQSRLWLSDTNFLLDYSRPIVTNEILVSWALMREAKQLPRNHPSLEGSNATRDGIIIMSLDQNIALPARIVTTILTSFKIFHTYHVIWQYGGDMTDETIPPNVRIMPYVPLNDLVGHPKTRLLVTSADNYHQNLALYHSLPILCIPLQPVQRQNARKTDRRQHGLVIPPENLTIKTFVQAMKKLLFNDTYCRRLEQPSRMMKMKQPASQRSMVEWIELSLANNFDVLKPYAVHMPWARYAMMDIALLVAIVFGNAIFLVANSILLGMRRVWDIYGRRRLPGMGQSVNRLVKPVLPSTTVTPIMKIPGSQLSPTTTLTATKSFKQQ